MQTSDAPAGTTLRHVEANGLDFAYFEGGEGPLALLVHGFPDTPHGWRDLIPTLLQAGYRVVAPFTRGYAPTEVPAERDIPLEVLADDLVALVSAVGAERAVLLGHDWGAATAYLAAARSPSLFEKLVAVGIPHPGFIRPSLRLLWLGRHFVTLRLPGAVKRAQKNDLALIDTLYRRWSPTWSFGPEETAPVKRAFADEASLDAAFGYYRGFQPGKVHPALKKPIEVPTLAVAGLDDPAVDVDVYHRAERAFAAGYEVATMPGGHFVHRESPRAFAEAVTTFLA
ncbi:MAG: alpha/beta hydrolase [Myxococcales bacterium]|nr:alpha/beta hydrolase [Myxococcales bacterium]